ncbi:MAG: prepilin-type N-terminal cleavage/methylation domain-containing protein [Bacteroidota bacterium]
MKRRLRSMKPIKKIPAFTLLEVLVALALTVIVVGVTYAVLGFVSRNVKVIGNNYNHSTQFSLLEQQLTIDMNRYHQASFHALDDKLNLRTSLDSVSYQFYDDIILRGQDTLWNGGYSKYIYWKGNKIKNGRLDAIKIELDDRNKGSFLFIYSEPDAVQIMTAYGD